MDKKLTIGELEIVVTYRKKMKNIYLRVGKNGDITVSAPQRTPNYLIKKLVIANYNEVKRRRDAILSTLPKQKNYVTGEKHFIFGKEYELEVQSAKKNNFAIRDGKIILQLKEESSAQKVFLKGVRALLKTTAENFVKEYEGVMGVHANELRIKKMKTRWGTCNIEKKRIWINQELVKYPVECLEHIVVHELTHLLETNHTPRFYTLLEKYYPTYKQNDQLIKDFTRFLNGR